MKKLLTSIFLAASFHAEAQPCIPNTSSLQFDGFSSYVSLAGQAGLDLTAAITVEAWVYSTSWGFTSAQNSIACKHGWSQGEGGYVLRAGGTGELSFNVGGLDINGNPVSWQEVISPAGTLTLNAWHHVAGTFDGNEVKCYINGTLQNTTFFSGTIVPSPAYPLTIGRLSDPGQFPDRYWSGSLDEIRVWNRALSQAEIQAGMNDHLDPATATGLVSYRRFNEGTGASAADLQSGNNGTCNGNTWDVSVPFNTVPPVPVISYSNGILTSDSPTGNQWSLNGSPVAGATQDTYTPLQNGDYTVTVTNGSGCSSTSSVYTVIDVGVDGVKGQPAFRVYPNPVTDASVLEFVLPENGSSFGLSLRNICSGELMVKKLVRDSGKTTVSLSMQEWPAGVYVLTVSGNEGVLMRDKLVVQ